METQQTLSDIWKFEMKNNEINRVENLSNWYVTEQLNFDKLLIQYRYKTIKQNFYGEKALELGPADGVMTSLLLKDFQSLTIVEGSQQLLDKIPSAQNLTKIQSLFEEFNPDESYDSIIMEHILEHVEDPTSLLRRAKRWLTPNGKIFIGVPNANSIHRLVGVKMKMLEDQFQLNDRDILLGHRRVYSWDTLKTDIKESGLSLIEIGGVYFKPVSNFQIEKHWTKEMIDGFYLLGKDFPEVAAEIYAICGKN
jgi:2-polyprenyl-3-methyl-5-hydroxy-6-metoxy-1,4-benzoquinol methylase